MDDLGISPVPNGISGVYEVKHAHSDKCLTIGKTSNLRWRVSQALLDAIKGHVVGKGETVGMYQRKSDVRKKP